MYEETKVKFNWKSLLLKLLIIIFIVALIIVLINFVFKKKDDYSKSFKNNMNTLKEVGTEYFKGDNLPKEIGDSIKVSLDELIKNEDIKTLKVGKNTCDKENSYIKVVKKTRGYELETTLICGEEKSTSYTYLGCVDNNCSNSASTTTTTTTTTKKTTTTKRPTTTTKPTTTTTTQVKYAVIFNRNLGSEVDTIYVKKNNAVTKPNDPVREGYKFVGWYYNDELYDFNTPVNKNIILIAKWERK